MFKILSTLLLTLLVSFPCINNSSSLYNGESIGICSSVANDDNSLIIPNNNYKLVEDYSILNDKSKDFIFVLKNIDNKGAGVLYKDVSIEKSFTNIEQWALNSLVEIQYLNFDYINDYNNLIDFYFNLNLFNSDSSQFERAIFNLHYSIDDTEEPHFVYLYSLGFFNLDMTNYRSIFYLNSFNIDNCFGRFQGGSFSKLFNSSWLNDKGLSNLTPINILTTFFDFYYFNGNSFTINSFNPFGDTTYTLSSIINSSLPGGAISNSNGGYYTIKLPYFTLNGVNILFNEIRIIYSNVANTHILYDNSDSPVELNSNSAYAFEFLYFLNTYTNQQLMVATARFKYISSGDSSYNVLLSGYSWVSTDYQTLYFYDDLTSSQFNTLRRFNSLNGGIGGSSSTIIGSTNVFTLIGSAFSSLLPFLNIEVLPGITIGLLILLPLVAGIIILIIWVVKR